MKSHTDILLLAVALVFVSGVAMVMWNTLRRSRRKDPEEIERRRRMEVNRRGRITAAEVTDLLEPESEEPAAGVRRPLIIVYKYEVAGVTYEVSQDISALSSAFTSVRLTGSETVSVKYDPKAPTNSIVLCEEWSGIR
ncbi:MAG TPA: DUF3592 domain-containing protein [Terriglobia bacterium]|nr:DUF3592 domain-containing protein [Terriglobia bacterium]